MTRDKIHTMRKYQNPNTCAKSGVVLFLAFFILVSAGSVKPARAQTFKLTRQTFASMAVQAQGASMTIRGVGGWNHLGTMNSETYHMGLVTPVLMPSGPESLPEDYELSQNFPNPFNQSTRFIFKVPVASRIKVEIYTLLGQRIRTLVSDFRAPGVYSILFDGRDHRGQPLSSGLYLCQLTADNFQQTIKFTLVR